MDEHKSEEQSKKIKIYKTIVKPKDIESLPIIEIARKYPPYSWKKLFEDADDEINLISRNIDNFEKDNGKSLPLRRDVFKAFELCDRRDIKVVIFGQDPYHQLLSNGLPRAQGLSFSVSKKDELPSSLRNIYKEIKNDVGIDNSNKHGDLSSWARQGVMLLNACLTVKPSEALSHKKIWDPFIKKALKDISEANPKCIYVFWGGRAKALIKMLVGNQIKLQAAHPSGLSAARGFFECKHFSKINEILRSQGKKEINWEVD